MILTYECSADVHWGMDLFKRDVIVSFLGNYFTTLPMSAQRLHSVKAGMEQCFDSKRRN